MPVKDKEEKQPETPGQKAAKVYVARAIDYQTVFGSDTGRRVLYDMFSAHHIMGSTMPRSGNINDLLINEGERNVVLRILSLLKIDAAKVHKLIQESDNNANF